MIRSIPFQRHKYGRRLLVDVAPVGALHGFIQTREPHALRFTEVMLVTSGCGELSLDCAPLEVRPGSVFVTGPGQVRSWRLGSPLQASVAFFEPEFGEAEVRGACRLDDPGFSSALSILERMREGIAAANDAVLWPALQLLLRGLAPRERPPPVARRFTRLVERHYRDRPRVLDYARLLRVTPEHLSRVIRAHTGEPPSAIIHRRILLEAKRLLLYTDATVSAIADALRFSDASWFNKFFQRCEGVTPARFRAVTR